MSTLASLLKGLHPRSTHGNLDFEVGAVCSDSRKVTPGDVYVAVNDELHDGMKWLADALSRGAGAVVLSKLPQAPEGEGGEAAEPAINVPYVLVPHAGIALALMCANANDNPSAAMDLIGVTGTSGKTTTATLIHAILMTAGRRAGLFGTAVGAEFLGRHVKTGLTTPEAPELQAILKEMRLAGCDTVTLEVSSHGIVLKRVAGCEFAVGVFTGLGSDHLDFHGSHDAYGESKVDWLISELPKGKRCKGVVVPFDDEWGQQVHSEFRGRILTFGWDEEADIHPPHLELTASGTRGRISTLEGTLTLDLKLIGRHNVRNAMAAIAAAQLLGIPAIDIVDGLSRVKRVPGRLDPVENHKGITVLVDYAHKPDALEAVLKSLRELATEGARLIVVFGCGGDRDRLKRPEMGKLAYALADFVVVTSDNPRSEDPATIIEEILLGLPVDADPERLSVEVDRAAAIALGIERAEPGDIVLIAGKGHETGQVIGAETRPFDDRVVAAEVLAQKPPVRGAAPTPPRGGGAA